MRKRIWSSLSLLLFTQIALAVWPEKPQLPLPDNASLLSCYPKNSQIESRLDVDITGDGLNDVVFIAASEDARVLTVMMVYADELSTGLEPIG